MKAYHSANAESPYIPRPKGRGFTAIFDKSVQRLSNVTNAIRSHWGEKPTIVILEDWWVIHKLAQMVVFEAKYDLYYATFMIFPLNWGIISQCLM